MAELADALVLGTNGVIRVGSSPTVRTNFFVGSSFNGRMIRLHRLDKGSTPFGSTNFK
jgi:hypothetical protein